MNKIKVSYRLPHEINNKLINVSLLLRKSKNDLVTTSIDKYLDELIKDYNLQEKIDILNK